MTTCLPGQEILWEYTATESTDVLFSMMTNPTTQQFCALIGLVCELNEQQRCKPLNKLTIFWEVSPKFGAWGPSDSLLNTSDFCSPLLKTEEYGNSDSICDMPFWRTKFKSYFEFNRDTSWVQVCEACFGSLWAAKLIPHGVKIALSQPTSTPIWYTPKLFLWASI